MLREVRRKRVMKRWLFGGPFSMSDWKEMLSNW
jgi:hypothetical protein